MSDARSTDAALLDAGVVVVVGCGGVGKTTVAAALGVEALGNRPQAIPRAQLDQLGVREPGALSAVMLDMKRTFDDLVARFAESDAARERILGNPIYQHVSEALAGSVEYSAMEKVYELWERGEHELIVVDTPPAQHALDFLEAPQRLLEFLDSRLVQMLIHPAFAAGRVGFRLFQSGARWALHLMERVSGIGFLEDLSEFLLAFEGMSAGFRQRATRVRGLLLGPEASFVLVAGPGGESVRQASELRQRLLGYGVRLAGTVVNRVRTWPGAEAPPSLEGVEADLPRLAQALAERGGDAAHSADAARAALAVARGYAGLVLRDAQATEGLRVAMREQGRFFRAIPELPEDVHDLAGLARIADALFAREQEP